MRAVSGFLAALSAAMTPALAFAHSDHLTEIGGHSHWIGLAALGAVVVIALLAASGAERGKAPKRNEASSDTLEG